MVSLAAEPQLQTDGLFSINGGAGMSNADTAGLLDGSQELGTDIEPRFKRISTPPLLIILIILMILEAVALFVIPLLCPESACGISSYSLLLYLHSVMWFVIMIADRYLRVQHNILRSSGYLEFYRETRNIRRTPFVIYSGGNAILLILVTILNDYCDPAQAHCNGIPLSKINYLQIMCVAEIVIVVPLLIILLGKTFGFNRSEASPDVNQDDMMTTYLHSHHNSVDIGFRDEDFVDDILEKQADLIRYLKQHNATLGRKIMQLRAEHSAKT